jgi:hypothetical protein
MKKFIFLSFLIASSSLISTPAYAAPSCAAGGTCVVGDTGPGGGLVFFVKSTGAFNVSYVLPGRDGDPDETFSTTLTSGQQAALTFVYLEVAPTGRAVGSWGEGGATTGGTSLLIGTAKSNTENILLTQVGDVANNAALFANQYSNNGFSDWYLPSYDELLLIMLRVKLGTFSTGDFPLGLWSSSDYGDANTAGYSALNQLGNNVNRVGGSAGVRAIRSFSYTPPVAVVDAAESEAKRKEKIRTNQQSLVASLQMGEVPTLAIFQDSALSGVNNSNFEGISQELINTSGSTPISLEAIERIIEKFATIEKLADRSRRDTLYTQQLVKIGLIESDQPQKSWITAQLKKLSSGELDTFAKTMEQVAIYTAQVQGRKDRLKLIQAKIKARYFG